MKILFHSQDKAEILSAKLLLAARGIPSYIGSESSGPAIGFLFANKYTLWVCIDAQYDDAAALLKDPAHEVKEPIDMIEFQDYADSSVLEVDKLLLQKMLWGCLAVFGILGLAWIALRELR